MRKWNVFYCKIMGCCAIVLSLIICVVGYSGAAEKKIVVKMTHVQSATHLYTKSSVVFGNKLKELSNGTMEVEVFPNAILGSERVILERMQLGAIDFAAVTASPLAGFSGAYNLFSLPFLFDNPKQLFEIVDNNEIREALSNTLVKKNIRPIAYWLSGTRSYYGTEPIKSVKDFQGKKVRCMENAYILKTYESLGAIPTALPWSEVYMGLQTKIVDGAEGAINSYLDAKLNEVAPYVAVMETNVLPHVFVISGVTWSRLNENQRQWVLEAAKVAEIFEREAMIKELDGLNKRLVELKIETAYLKKAELRKTTGPVYEQYRKEAGADAYKLLEKIKKW